MNRASFDGLRTGRSWGMEHRDSEGSRQRKEDKSHNFEFRNCRASRCTGKQKKIPPYSPLYKKGGNPSNKIKSPFFKGGFRGILWFDLGVGKLLQSQHKSLSSELPVSLGLDR